MSSISAVQLNGNPYSHPEGGIQTVLKMVADMPESKTRQIIVVKKNLDDFVRKNKLLDQAVMDGKNVFDVMVQKSHKGCYRRVLGIHGANLEFYYMSFFGMNYCILTLIKIDGRQVYALPKRMDGLMRLEF